MKRLIKGSSKMQVVYAQEDFPQSYSKSIFLAGPTPRSTDVQSWRPEVIKLLEGLGYDGVVFVPEQRSGPFEHYDNQVKWEHQALNKADCILFWIPRDLETMPAFTTNVEFGMWYKSGKIVVGAPEDAPKNTYLKTIVKSENIKFINSLEDTVKAAIQLVGSGVYREGAETDVPLFIWNTPTFQHWYKAQKSVGNELRYADVQYIYKPAPKKDFVFLWILYVQVYIAAEDRIKDNELVLARTDMCCGVLYYKGKTPIETKVILVKEFRSSVSNDECYVYEIPGGSSKTSEDDYTIVQDEINEELGFVVNTDKLIDEGKRQVMSTFSAHKIHLYSYELSDDELKVIESQLNEVHGIEEDSERTYTVIKTLDEILNENLLDWVNIGQILSILYKKMFAL